MWNQPIIKINGIDILLANVLKSWLTALLFTFWSLKYGFTLWNMKILKGHLLSAKLEACDFEHRINILRMYCCSNSQLIEAFLLSGSHKGLVIIHWRKLTGILKPRTMQGTEWWFVVSCRKCDFDSLCLCYKGQWNWAVNIERCV